MVCGFYRGNEAQVPGKVERFQGYRSEWVSLRCFGKCFVEIHFSDTLKSERQYKQQFGEKTAVCEQLGEILKSAATKRFRILTTDSRP